MISVYVAQLVDTLASFDSAGGSLVTDLLVGCLGFVLQYASVLVGGSLSFSVQDCTRQTCPGSAYNLITAAWANMGYVAHSDFIALITETRFGSWAPLLYAVGAIGALISVALNSPPKQWAWFLMGPGIYWFLVDAKQDVRGVAWRVAGQSQPMKQVWVDAETGLANSQLVKRLGLSVNKERGPSGEYPVAWMLVFLDGLFSSSTNTMISWLGMGRQEGTGGNDTNLANATQQVDGPWYVLANRKWGMLENIVSVQARDPDVRDALVTFLASECGDQFKKGVHTANYIAASSSRGKTIPRSVLKNDSYDFTFTGQASNTLNYKPFVHGLDTEAIPTPRSIVRLFNQDPQAPGSFRKFSTLFEGSASENPADTKGRTVEIVCSEYLYTIVQALRWESGHSYWQLVRSAPEGFDRKMLFRTLFYGWDIRKQKDGPWASETELDNYVKQLIFVYLLRNELLFAPQITEAPQRFAPSEQTRNFSESYVRSQGSRSKAAEMYNWAVMMPYVQGILTYLVLILYPFAAMFMVIPGYWKAFFTWVTFLAWVKLWDVGFAICHTLERSVWAQIGNHSAMARVANMIIDLAGDNSSKTVRVGASAECQDTSPAICAVPDVTEQAPLRMNDAWELLDKSLLLTGSADLDLANGYYVYIMSALYFAVPAVTGQLVLGAKSGMSSLVTQGVGQAAGEAGGAAKSGTSGEATNRLQTNQQSMTAGAATKANRQNGLVLQQLETANAAAEAEISSGRIGQIKQGLDSGARGAELRASSYESNREPVKRLGGIGGSLIGSGTGGADDATGRVANGVGQGAMYGFESQLGALRNRQYKMAAGAAGFGAQNDWQSGFMRSAGSAMQGYARSLEREADYNEKQATWEARNEFANHIAGAGGVAGINAGSMAPGPKPTDGVALALAGQLGSRAESASRFANFDQLSQAAQVKRYGQTRYGGQWFNHNWGGGVSRGDAVSQGINRSASDFQWALKNSGAALRGGMQQAEAAWTNWGQQSDPPPPPLPTRQQGNGG